jgi:hypothetical protein
MANILRIVARGGQWPFAVVVAFGVCAPATAGKGGTTLCCFANWRYSGTCVVQVEAGQSCGDLLGDLNNPMSASSACGGGGRSGAVRGGWTPVDCGGGGSSSGTSAGTISQTNVVPVEPSPMPDADDTTLMAPDDAAVPFEPIGSTSPTFVAPVSPTTTAPVSGPSLIIL